MESLNALMNATVAACLGWPPQLFWLLLGACGVTAAALAVLKVVTAALAVAAALELRHWLPTLLRLPSADQLRQALLARNVATERRQDAEEDRLEVQQQLDAVLGVTDAGFIATDHNGAVTVMNPAAERMLGCSLALARGLDLWKVFVREGHPPGIEWNSPVQVMIDQGVDAKTTVEVTVVSRTGMRTPVQFNASLVHGSDGTVRGCTIVFRDVTSIQQAADESGRLSAIVNSSVDAIIGKALQGRITSWNAAAAMCLCTSGPACC